MLDDKELIVDKVVLINKDPYLVVADGKIDQLLLRPRGLVLSCFDFQGVAFELASGLSEAVMIPFFSHFPP